MCYHPAQMGIYRYSRESIDALTTKTRRHHTAGFLIFTVAVCAAGLANLPLRAALVCDAVFALVIGVVMVGSRNKARQRTANLLRSTEIEIDDEKATWRSALGKTDFYRSDIVEVCFSKRGIWLRSRSRRLLMRFPPELEGFDAFPALLQEWLPQHVVRRDSPPSSLWTNLRMYGIWTGVALMVYAAIASRTSAIAIPACFLAGPGIAWYFAWCGRRINERTWKILLPLTGYFVAAAFLGRAFTLML